MSKHNRCLFVAQAVVAAFVGSTITGTASAQAPAHPLGSPPFERAGFGYNLTPCPVGAAVSKLANISVDTFTDGTPLPSCGGTYGQYVFKMVWTGFGWALFGPSVKIPPPPPPPPKQPVPMFQRRALSAPQLASAHGIMGNQEVYLINNIVWTLNPSSPAAAPGMSFIRAPGVGPGTFVKMANGAMILDIHGQWNPVAH